MKKLKAFTLGELLITIGIVGVISALVLPTLTHKKPNENKAMFRKANYVIERTASEMIMDDDVFPNEVDSGSRFLAFFDPSIEEDADVDADGTYRRTRRNTGKFFCQTFARSLNTQGTVNCDDGGAADYIRTDGRPDPEDYNPVANPNAPGHETFATGDGIHWYIPPTIICDPTNPNEPDCIDNTQAGTVANQRANEPECPVAGNFEGDNIPVLPYICVWFDVNGPEEPNRMVNRDDVQDASGRFIHDVRDADRGYLIIYWNGKVRAPRGQTSRYLKDVKVL